MSIFSVVFDLAHLLVIFAEKGIPIDIKSLKVGECTADVIPKLIEPVLKLNGVVGTVSPEDTVDFLQMGDFGINHRLPFSRLCYQSIGDLVIEGHNHGRNAKKIPVLAG